MSALVVQCLGRECVCDRCALARWTPFSPVTAVILWVGGLSVGDPSYIQAFMAPPLDESRGGWSRALITQKKEKYGGKDTEV